MFTPLHSSPLARTPQPRDSAPSPARSITAAKWDEDERHTTGHLKRPETICSNVPHQKPKSTRFSSDTVLGIIKSYDPNSSPKVPCPSPSSEDNSTFDLGPGAAIRGPKASASKSATVPSLFASDPASPIATTTTTTTTTTIAFTTTSSSTPPAYSELTSKNLCLLENVKFTKRKSVKPSVPSLQLSGPPARLSPLRSPSRLPPSPISSREEVEPPRKLSLTDPHLHKQPSQYFQDLESPARFPVAHPSTPSTPPSTSRGAHCYQSSLGTPPYSQALVHNPSEPLAGYPSHQHISITSTESSRFLSGLAQSPTTTIATSPRNRESHTSYGLQHTVSAWDEWDSDEEEEKVGLVKYWRGRRWRSSRGSLGGNGAARRESVGNDETEQEESGVGGRRKRRGFVRVISCGCVKS